MGFKIFLQGISVHTLLQNFLICSMQCVARLSVVSSLLTTAQVSKLQLCFYYFLILVLTVFFLESLLNLFPRQWHMGAVQ